MERWVRLNIERSRDEMIHALRENIVGLAPGSGEVTYGLSAIRLCENGWAKVMEGLPTRVAEREGTVDSTFAPEEQYENLRNMNTVLRRQLKEQNKIAREVYGVIVGPAGSSTRTLDTIHKQLLTECERIREELFLLQHAAKDTEFDKKEFCMLDYFHLAEFKITEAANRVLWTESSGQGGGGGGGIEFDLKLQQLHSDYQAKLSRAERQLEQERQNLRSQAKASRLELEDVQVTLTASAEKASKQHAEEVAHLKELHDETVRAMTEDGEQAMQEMQHQFAARIATMKTTDAESRAEAISDMRKAMEELKRNRHIAAVEEGAGQQASDATPARRTARGGDPSEAVMEDDVDPHAIWEGETKETLVQLLQGRRAELEMIHSSHSIQTKAHAMEWESALREIVARYEKELQAQSRKAEYDTTKLENQSRVIETKNTELDQLKKLLASERENYEEKLNALQKESDDRLEHLKFSGVKVQDDLLATKRELKLVVENAEHDIEQYTLREGELTDTVRELRTLVEGYQKDTAEKAVQTLPMRGTPPPSFTSRSSPTSSVTDSTDYFEVQQQQLPRVRGAKQKKGTGRKKKKFDGDSTPLSSGMEPLRAGGEEELSHRDRRERRRQEGESETYEERRYHPHGGRRTRGDEADDGTGVFLTQQHDKVRQGRSSKGAHGWSRATRAEWEASESASDFEEEEESEEEGEEEEEGEDYQRDETTSREVGEEHIGEAQLPGTFKPKARQGPSKQKARAQRTEGISGSTVDDYVLGRYSGKSTGTGSGSPKIRRKASVSSTTRSARTATSDEEEDYVEEVLLGAGGPRPSFSRRPEPKRIPSSLKSKKTAEEEGRARAKPRRTVSPGAGGTGQQRAAAGSRRGQPADEELLELGSEEDEEQERLVVLRGRGGRELEEEEESETLEETVTYAQQQFPNILRSVKRKQRKKRITEGRARGRTVEEGVDGYFKTVDDEFPEELAGDLQALVAEGGTAPRHRRRAAKGKEKGSPSPSSEASEGTAVGGEDGEGEKAEDLPFPAIGAVLAKNEEVQKEFGPPEDFSDVIAAIKAAQTMEPSALELLPKTVTEPKFYELLGQMALLSEYAASRPGEHSTFVLVKKLKPLMPLRTWEKIPNMPVKPVHPLDVTAVLHYFQEYLIPTPEDLQEQQREANSAEHKLYQRLVEIVNTLSSLARAAGIPRSFQSVSWADLDNWVKRGSKSGAGSALIPAREVKQLSVHCIDLLECCRSLQRKIASSPLSPHGATTSPAGGGTKLPQPKPPAMMIVNQVQFSGDSPTTPPVVRSPRMHQMLVKSAETNAMTTRRHLLAQRAHQRRWNAALSGVDGDGSGAGSPSNPTPSPKGRAGGTPMALGPAAKAKTSRR